MVIIRFEQHSVTKFGFKLGHRADSFMKMCAGRLYGTNDLIKSTGQAKNGTHQLCPKEGQMSSPNWNLCISIVCHLSTVHNRCHPPDKTWDRTLWTIAPSPTALAVDNVSFGPENDHCCSSTTVLTRQVAVTYVLFHRLKNGTRRMPLSDKRNYKRI